jgi:hypothetical protein
MGASAQTSIFGIQKTPSPNANGNTLNAIAAVSPTDVWAVGFQNDNNLNGSRTLIQHFDGTAWTTIKSPNPAQTKDCGNGNSGNILTGVAALASSDVWAVGSFFNCHSAFTKQMVLHWNGTAWSVVATPQLPANDNAGLNGIKAFASNNIYAVGFQPPANGGGLTLIEHFDGTSWSVVPSPNGNTSGNFLDSISGSGPNDIWAVGELVAQDVEQRTLALHFDGTTWSVVPTQNPVSGGSLDANILTSVVSVAPNDATAVGFTVFNNTTLTMVQHWDGTSWSLVDSPNKSSNFGDFNTLRGVVAVNSSDLYAVGFFADAASAGQQQTMILHFDGQTWSIVNSPTRGLAQQLNGAFALPNSTKVWVAGAASKQGIQVESGFLQLPLTLVLFAPGA